MRVELGKAAQTSVKQRQDKSATPNTVMDTQGHSQWKTNQKSNTRTHMHTQAHCVQADLLSILSEMYENQTSLSAACLAL